ncbi:MAG: hypothetical protein KJN97_04730, partial [Deltaproteobacteria bacterium]|nr:hypothetical protein [Deltaproteobacteria bacterium]
MRGSIALYIVAGGLLYFGLLRLLTRVRFSDVSYEARFVVISSMVLLILFLAFGRSNTYRLLFEQLIP